MIKASFEENCRKQADMSHDNPAYEICINTASEEIFSRKEHALIGISPFNSYFIESRMTKLFSWALNNFKDITIFIPDEISAYTLCASGYTEDKARQKTKRQDRYLKHKAINALISKGFSENNAEKKILCLSEIAKNEKYLELYNRCLSLYENDKNFKEGCLMTSKWVLKSRVGCNTLEKESFNIAVKYFLSELPLYIGTPYILDIPSSLFVYKDTPEFLRTIYANSSLIYPNQGYLEVNFL